MNARAVWFTAPRQVDIHDEPLPSVGITDVRVRSIVSAISHGTEMLVYRGRAPDDLDLDLPTLRGSFAFPIKYGYASVGRIVEVGAGVDSLHDGDVVFVHHPHQTEFVVPAAMPVRLPPGVDPFSGVFLANMETAVNVVLDAAPRLSERVVVFGQGVVGLLITQLLKRTGLGELCVVDPLPIRRELAMRVGADHAFGPEDPLPHGEFDLAIEVSGHAEALNTAINSVAFGATVLVCSWYGTKPVPLMLGGAFHRRRLRLVSSQVGTIDAALQPRWSRERRMQVACTLLPEVHLEPLISHRISFDAAAEAYRLVDECPQQTVQVVLTYPS